MNRQIKKMVGLMLSFGWLFLSMAGCSSMNRITDWVNPWSSVKPRATPIVEFAAHIRRNPGNPDSHYLLATYYQERGNHRKAVEEFTKVLSINPYHAEAYNGRGVSYDLLGDFSGAIESYHRALKLNPCLDYVQNNLGYSYLLRGDLDNAVSSFKKAIALNDRESRFHNNLGLAYAEKGQFILALAEFTAGGDEAGAYHYLAQICFRKGLYSEAKDYSASALKLNPSMTSAQFMLDAAHRLARVFPQIAGRMETGGLIIPGKTGVETQESENSNINDPSPQLEAPAQVEQIVDRTEEKIPEVKESVIPNESLIVNLDEAQTGGEIAGQPTRVEIKEETVTPAQKDDAKQSSPPTDVGIEISNGNGVSGTAKRLGEYLKGKGFKIVRLTNADHFNHSGSRIYYQKGFGADAEQVAQQIVLISKNMNELKKLGRDNIKVKVLIGKDLASQNNF